VSAPLHAVAVLWDNTGRPIHNASENSPPLAPSQQLFEYGQTKAEAESLVLAANGEQLLTTVLRPAGIYGPGDRVGAGPGQGVVGVGLPTARSHLLLDWL
jgi:nucleoside-diphosphate-sugar epimerase